MDFKKTTVNEIVVISFVDHDGDTGHVSHIYLGDGVGQNSFQLDYHGRDGMYDMSGLDEAKQLELICDFQNDYPEYASAITRIKTTVEVTEAVIEDTDALREIRQRFALSKLNNHDIKALNLTSLQTYIKTKYHNT